MKLIHLISKYAIIYWIRYLSRTQDKRQPLIRKYVLCHALWALRGLEGDITIKVGTRTDIITFTVMLRDLHYRFELHTNREDKSYYAYVSVYGNKVILDRIPKLNYAIRRNKNFYDFHAKPEEYRIIDKILAEMTKFKGKQYV